MKYCFDSACSSIILAVMIVPVASPVAAAGASPKVNVVAAPAGMRPIVARRDESNTIHLVCDSTDGPQYLSSKDSGKSLSAPIELVDSASRKPGLEFIVWDLAVSPDGHVHVAIGNNAWKLKLPKEEWGYFYTSRVPGDSSFGPLKNINHVPSEGFSIAARDDGTVSAVWMADKLFANVSHDHGKSFGPTIEIDPRLNPCNCCTTSSTYAADGRLAILYREETDNQRDIYLALWNQTNNEVNYNRISTTPWSINECPMTYYSVKSTKDGFVAAWPTKGRIYSARMDAEGHPLSPNEISTGGSNGMRTGVLALDANDGSLVVVWKKDKQLAWELYDAKGRIVGKPGSASSDGNGAAGVVTKSGDVVLFR